MSTQSSSSSEDGSLNIAFFSVLIVSLSLLFIFSEGEAIPQEGKKEMAVLSSTEEILRESFETDDIALYNETSLLAQSTPTFHKPQVLATKAPEESVKKRWVRLTAYAPLDPGAEEGMCFSGNPMITASGTYVRDGIVAANFLSFGTEIKIPSLFGDKVFTVEDRMSSRYTNTVDVLVSSKREALNFGIKRAYIEILN
jgi:3D (Asp-Asp-Asp) domain-containing protein